MTTVPKTTGRQKRRATEASIIDAFDRLVRREGLRSIGVNAVVKEAGVGKGLIYKYFGGLPGVVKAWSEQNKLWPSTAELMGVSDEAYSGLNLASQMKTLMINHINALRQNPVSTDVLADELMAPSGISEALKEARARMGAEHQAIYGHNHDMRKFDNFSLLVIMTAAANYLAMRAARSPRFLTEALDTEEGWNMILARMERIIDIVAGGAEEIESDTPRVHTKSSPIAVKN